MSNLGYKTIGNSNPKGKPRIYFCCHNSDFEKYFEVISNEIFRFQNCAIWYRTDDTIVDDLFFVDLEQMHLFVMPVTNNLLNTENDALSVDFQFAIEHHIPVLPLMQETGLENLFNQKCGELQFLDKNIIDDTAIKYEEKLEKYLSSVLIGDELAEKIRAAFDAYVFLSYRKKDRKYAQELMRLIHKNEFCRDIAIWYDEFLTPGENFNDSIKDALQKSDLFVLAVTPNLVNENNYIMTTEYPMALEERKLILPAEIVPTDREQLFEKYKDIPTPANAYDDVELSKALLESIKKMAIIENEMSPEHNFFIGLAYLSGIDVEVNRELAVKLITDAAQNELPEAMVKLISMYSDGIGVPCDQKEVLFWSEKLANYFFRKIFNKDGALESIQDLKNLFVHYNDTYWHEAIEIFLFKVDSIIDISDIQLMYSIIFKMDISEYTLFFDTCTKMMRYREETQMLLITDILTKSVDGTYPPYGPLFWYVPEYELYEVSLLSLSNLKIHYDFAKMLALVRDVCWIFGRFNTSAEITNRVQGKEIFMNVDLCGIRRGLCELFFTGDTEEKCGGDVYPRCFNIAEAKHWKEYGCGLLGRMPSAFKDELKLYAHEMFSELCGEYIGIVAAPFDRERLERILPQKSCRKLCGLFFSPTEDQIFEILTVNTNHLKRVYAPEHLQNTSHWDLRKGYVSKPWNQINGIYVSEEGLLYFYDTVCLPDVITIIKDCDFYGCSTLVSITLPKSVKTIESQAFVYCSALKSIVIPEGVDKIDFRVFADCSALKSISLPKSVQTIERYAFENCKALSSITLPGGLRKIRFDAFKGCKSLALISTPNSVTEIEKHAFMDCCSLTSITLPDSVTDLGEGVFTRCTSLKRINNCPPMYSAKDLGVSKDCTIVYRSSKKDEEILEILDGVTEVNKADITNRHELKTVILPNSVTKIGMIAFENCCALESIAIPDSVTEIGTGVFKGCQSLKSITLPANMTEITGGMFSGCKALESITIPNGVTYISGSSFEGCSSIKTIILPDGVTEIGWFAFQGCCSLKSIVIPQGVTKIGRSTFARCHALASISVPNDLTEIGDYAFGDCIELSSITIPDSVTKIEHSAFSGCRSLEVVTFGNGVKTIEHDAFSGCRALSSITFPDSVTTVGTNVFKRCKSLNRIYNCPPGYTAEELGCPGDCVIEFRPTKEGEDIFNVPNGVTVVNEEDITNRRMLRTVIFSDDVEEIGYQAFRNCLSLESITIPNGVTKISMLSFENCRALVSIIIPEGVTEIGDWAFQGCSSLVSIKIPDSVKKIGHSAFKGCSALESITISDSVTEIRDRTFEGCTMLKTITIPTSVREISKEAFIGCKGLKEIILSRRFEEDLLRILDGFDLAKMKIHWL